MKYKTTDALDQVLCKTQPDEADLYFDTYSDKLEQCTQPFSNYMRTLIKQKGLTQRCVFERAGLSDRYGYRLLTEEKHTLQRDYIIRICFAAKLSLVETQRALKFYGMSELYSKIKRDSVFIIALNKEIYDIGKVNEFLRKYDLPPLRESSHDM